MPLSTVILMIQIFKYESALLRCTLIFLLMILCFGFYVLGFMFWVLCFGFYVLGFMFWVLCFGFLYSSNIIFRPYMIDQIQYFFSHLFKFFREAYLICIISSNRICKRCFKLLDYFTRSRRHY